MKRIACLLLLTVGAVSAQSNQNLPQLFPTRATQNGATQQVLESLKLSLNTQPRPRIQLLQPTRCSIPLLKVPVPSGQNFAAKTVPTKPKVDPKMVVPPPQPACSGNR